MFDIVVSHFMNSSIMYGNLKEHTIPFTDCQFGNFFVQHIAKHFPVVRQYSGVVNSIILLPFLNEKWLFVLFHTTYYLITGSSVVEWSKALGICLKSKHSP